MNRMASTIPSPNQKRYLWLFDFLTFIGFYLFLFLRFFVDHLSAVNFYDFSLENTLVASSIEQVLNFVRGYFMWIYSNVRENRSTERQKKNPTARLEIRNQTSLSGPLCVPPWQLNFRRERSSTTTSTCRHTQRCAAPCSTHSLTSPATSHGWMAQRELDGRAARRSPPDRCLCWLGRVAHSFTCCICCSVPMAHTKNPLDTIILEQRPTKAAFKEEFFRFDGFCVGVLAHWPCKRMSLFSDILTRQD